MRGVSTVILLHGLGTDGEDWSSVAEALSASHWVLAPDQRGHGRSDRPGKYAFELMADDVVAMTDDLHVSRGAVVGHSMGGSVAFDLVERYPERVERLVIEDTPPPRVGWNFGDPPEEKPAGWTGDHDYRAVVALVKQINNPDPRWWEDLAKISVPTFIIGGGSTSHVDQVELAEVAALIPDAQIVTFEGAGHNVHGTRLREYLEVVTPFLRGDPVDTPAD
jgi:esterase